MKYKLTKNGNIVLKDGKPVIIDDDGNELTIDAIGAQKTINELRSEAKEHRLKASERGKLLEKIPQEIQDDPDKYVQAVQTVESMDSEHKVEIENLRTTMETGYQKKLDAKDEEIANVQGKLFEEKVGNKFLTSKVVTDTVLTPSIAKATFKDRFDKDGNGLDENGNIIDSAEKPGSPAGFDEALTIMIDSHPDKDSIWKGNQRKGSHTEKTLPGDEQKGFDEESGVDLISAGLQELN